MPKFRQICRGLDIYIGNTCIYPQEQDYAAAAHAAAFGANMLPTTISSGFPLPHNSVAFGHVTSSPSGGNGSSYNGGTTPTNSSNSNATTNGGGTAGPGGTGGSGGGGAGGGGGGGGVGGHQFSFASPTAAPSGKEGWYLSIAWQAAIHLCLTVALSPPLCSQFRIELVDVQRGFQFIAAE